MKVTKKQSRRRRRHLRVVPKPAAEVVKIHPKIRSDALIRAREKKRHGLARADVARFLLPYSPYPGVLPANHPKPTMAMDSAVAAWAQASLSSYWTEGLTFPGYAYLSELTLRPEYRVISQVIATEMTRKWITFQATDDDKRVDEEDEQSILEQGEQGPGSEQDEVDDKMAGDAEMQDGLMELQRAKQEKDEAENALAKQRAESLAGDDGKADRIKELTKEFERLNVRDLFAQIAEYDGYFGRVHLYLDTGSTDNPAELLTDIGNGADEVTKLKFKKGSLERLAVIEPVWTYPQSYNATDPLKPEWYNPSQWFVMGKQVHCSRLLTFVGRPVPDILKPAYAFGGLSLSQIAKPYVDNWLQTRQSVNDIIHAFSVMVLSTDMSSVIQASDSAGGTGSLFDRLDMFNMLRDNRGVFAIDKENETFENVSAPLASLDNLQAQAQEHMAAVSRIPLVKLLGISPHGLNASSEGELKTFYDTINSFQESLFRPNLTRVMHFAMMNLWGEVDEDITFKFNPLWALNEKEEAEVRKIKAETWDIMVNGVAAVHPEEVRKVVATDPDSDFQGIDVADVPDAPIDDTLNLTGKQPFAKGAQGEEAGLESDNSFGQAQDAARWNESDHPRVKGGKNAGEFTVGGGGSASKMKSVMTESSEKKKASTTKAEELFSEWYAGWSIKEASAGYPAKEGDILGGYEIDENEADDINEAADLLQDLARSEVSSHNEVWRGFALPPGKSVDEVFKRNDIHVISGLTATSHDKEVASKYTDPQFSGSEEGGQKVLLRISRRGGIIGHDSESGDLAGAETILPAGAKFRIAGKYQEGDVTVIRLYDPGSLNELKKLEN